MTPPGRGTVTEVGRHRVCPFSVCSSGETRILKRLRSSNLKLRVDSDPTGNLKCGLALSPSLSLSGGGTKKLSVLFCFIKDIRTIKTKKQAIFSFNDLKFWRQFDSTQRKAEHHRQEQIRVKTTSIVVIEMAPIRTEVTAYPDPDVFLRSTSSSPPKTIDYPDTIHDNRCNHKFEGQVAGPIHHPSD